MLKLFLKKLQFIYNSVLFSSQYYQNFNCVITYNILAKSIFCITCIILKIILLICSQIIYVAREKYILYMHYVISERNYIRYEAQDPVAFYSKDISIIFP